MRVHACGATKLQSLTGRVCEREIREMPRMCVGCVFLSRHFSESNFPTDRLSPDELWQIRFDPIAFRSWNLARERNRQRQWSNDGWQVRCVQATGSADGLLHLVDPDQVTAERALWLQTCAVSLAAAPMSSSITTSAAASTATASASVSCATCSSPSVSTSAAFLSHAPEYNPMTLCSRSSDLILDGRLHTLLANALLLPREQTTRTFQFTAMSAFHHLTRFVIQSLINWQVERQLSLARPLEKDERIRALALAMATAGARHQLTLARIACDQILPTLRWCAAEMQQCCQSDNDGAPSVRGSCVRTAVDMPLQGLLFCLLQVVRANRRLALCTLQHGALGVLLDILYYESFDIRSKPSGARITVSKLIVMIIAAYTNAFPSVERQVSWRRGMCLRHTHGCSCCMWSDCVFVVYFYSSSSFGLAFNFTRR
jgi:hypothetical protein